MSPLAVNLWICLLQLTYVTSVSDYGSDDYDEDCPKYGIGVEESYVSEDRNDIIIERGGADYTVKETGDDVVLML